MTYDATKKRVTFKYFLLEFLAAALVLIVASAVVWFSIFLIESHHHAAVENQKGIVVSSNHFWQAVTGETVVNPSSNLGRFVTDLTPSLTKAEADYKPGITNSLPKSITSLQTPDKKYGNLAYTSKVYIWGANSKGDGDFDPASYNEGGKFTQDFLNDLNTVVSGSKSGISDLTNAPLPVPGNTIPPIPWGFFILWFFVITTIAYVSGAYDASQDTFFSIARAQDANKVSKFAITLVALPICSIVWMAVIMENSSYRRQSKKLMKELQDPRNPLAEEARIAQEIVNKYKNSKHSQLPEIRSVLDAALATLETLQRTQQHADEVTARKEAINDMELLVPLASKGKEFHDDLNQDLKDFTDSRLTEIQKGLQLALGAGTSPVSNKKGDDGTGDVITPEVV